MSINTGLAALIIAAATMTGAITPPGIDTAPVYEDLGCYRITTYDVCCNEPQGRQSASGETLHYGHVAMNGVPFGTIVCIDGEEFEVVDRCGFDNTVDIFIENDSGVCKCNLLEYKEVFVKHE